MPRVCCSHEEAIAHLSKISARTFLTFHAGAWKVKNVRAEIWKEAGIGVSTEVPMLGKSLVKDRVQLFLTTSMLQHVA